MGVGVGFGRGMDIRSRAAVRLGLYFLLLGLAAVYAAKAIVEDRLQAFELRTAVVNAQRAYQALRSDLERIDASTRDWAWWDESVDFVRHPTPEFIQVNVPLQAFSDLSMDALVFLDAQRKPVYSAMPENKKTVPVPQAMLTALNRAVPDGTASLKTTGFKGILEIQGLLYLAACRPILSSKRTGNVQGWLWMLRLADSVYEIEIKSRTGVSVFLAPWTDPSVLPREFSADKELAPHHPLIELTHKEILSAELFSNGRNVPPTLILVRDTRQLAETAGQITTLVFILALCIVLAAWAGAIWSLQRYILTPMQALIRRFAPQDDEQDLPVHEIRALTHILDQNADNPAQMILDSIPMGVMLVDKKSKIIADINAYGASLIGLDQDEIIGSAGDRFFCRGTSNACPEVAEDHITHNQSDILLPADGRPVLVRRSAGIIRIREKEYVVQAFVPSDEKKDS